MRRAALLPALLLLGALVLAACGAASDASPDVPSTAAGAGPTTTAAGATATDADGEVSTDPEVMILQFARCMRAHGVKMADPKPGQGIQLNADQGSRATVEAAQKACQSYMKGTVRAPSKAEQAKVQQAALDFAKCLRDHGIDAPDPKFQDGGMMQGLGDGVDPKSAKFKAAQKACEPIMRAVMPSGAKRSEP